MKYSFKYRMLFLILPVLLFLGCGSDSVPPGGEDTPPPVTTVDDDYVYTNHNGIILAVNKEISNELSTTAEMRTFKVHIAELAGILPRTVIDKIKSDTIWVEEPAGSQTITYFPSDANSANKGKIVVYSVEDFVEDFSTNQPMLLVHYVCKLYLDKYLGDTDKNLVTATYNGSKSKYGSVYHSTGTKLENEMVASPAANDAATYFAELCETYFGENDFYPFDLVELERHDPDGLAMLFSIWGEVTFETNEYGITLPPADMFSHAAYDNMESYNYPIDPWYRKYIVADCAGVDYPIIASRFVADSALIQAKKIMEHMTQLLPEAMAEVRRRDFRVGIMGKQENVTDMPEQRNWNNLWYVEGGYDARGRGFGSTPLHPMMCIGEENIIRFTNQAYDRYKTQSIMVHEYAHCIDEYGLRSAVPGFRDRLNAAYRNAQDNDLWTGTYSMETVSEYWAEGVQAWFDTCDIDIRDPESTTGYTKIKYRTQLETYDPVLYNLISDYFVTDPLTGYHFDYE